MTREIHGARTSRRVRAGGGAASLLVAALFLAGCSVVEGPKQVDTFDLVAPTPATSRQVRASQILVPEPQVDRAYDTDRLVVRPKENEIAYFTGAQWSDRLPRLLQSRIVETLERSGRFRAAGRPGQGLAIDRQLAVDLRAFDYRPEEGRVTVRFTAKLMDDRSGRVLAVRDFAGEAPVAAGDAATIVAGFDAALSETLLALADWAGR